MELKALEALRQAPGGLSYRLSNVEQEKIFEGIEQSKRKAGVVSSVPLERRQNNPSRWLAFLCLAGVISLAANYVTVTKTNTTGLCQRYTATERFGVSISSTPKDELEGQVPVLNAGSQSLQQLGHFRHDIFFLPPVPEVDEANPACPV